MRTLLLGLLVVGCGGGSSGAVMDAPPSQPDAFVCKAPTTVFLSRGGGTYTPGNGDSRTNTLAVLASGSVTFGAYDKPSWADALACIQSRLAPFQIAITETDPGGTDHLEIVISPNDATEIGLSGQQPSLATTSANCALSPNQVGVVWPKTITDDATNTCELVVQLVGLLGGVEFTSACDDAMSFNVTTPTCGGPFKDGPLTCGTTQPAQCACGGPTQNSFAKMVKTYGAHCTP